MSEEEFELQLAKLIRKFVTSNKEEFEEATDYDFHIQEIVGRDSFDVECDITFSFTTEKGMKAAGYLD